MIDFGYGIDVEAEKEDYELDEKNCVETINGEIITWEELKRNGFDFISIKMIDDKGSKEICDLELA